jgi:hypothetical protein
MWKYLAKVGLLLAPFATLYLAELLVLPMNFFTYRCWEALIDSDGSVGLRGAFYPNQHLVMYERGDRLRFGDPNPRKAEWFTDEYGFRNRPCAHPPERYDYVLVGDSNIAGSGLDQSETLAEVVASKGNCSAYSYGASMRQKQLFWTDPRFLSHPPRTIVIECRTGEFYLASSYRYLTMEPCELPQSEFPMWARILRSRIHKQNMLQFVKSRLCSALYQTGTASEPPDLSLTERVEFMVSKVLAMQEAARARGSDFIFFLMPPHNRDRTLDAGILRLRDAGVKTIAYLPTSEHPDGVDLKWYYQVGRDSHWSKEAVQLTADEILMLGKK